jgi:hypothetical protein
VHPWPIPSWDSGPEHGGQLVVYRPRGLRTAVGEGEQEPALDVGQDQGGEPEYVRAGDPPRLDRFGDGAGTALLRELAAGTGLAGGWGDWRTAGYLPGSRCTCRHPAEFRSFG